MLALALVANASGTVNSGAFTVQYSAVNSMQIPDSVAKANGIKRDGETIIVMITLQKPTRDEPFKAVPANVTGSARTLMGDRTALKFRRVENAGSVYSLASFKLDSDEQTLTFAMEVKAVDDKATIPVSFNQRVYTE